MARASSRCGGYLDTVRPIMEDVAGIGCVAGIEYGAVSCGDIGVGVPDCSQTILKQFLSLGWHFSMSALTNIFSTPCLGRALVDAVPSSVFSHNRSRSTAANSFIGRDCLSSGMELFGFIITR